MIRESISLRIRECLPANTHSSRQCIPTFPILDQYAISIRESLFEYANDTRIYLSSNTRMSSCKHSQFIATQLTVTIARQRMTVTPRTDTTRHNSSHSQRPISRRLPVLTSCQYGFPLRCVVLQQRAAAFYRPPGRMDVSDWSNFDPLLTRTCCGGYRWFQRYV